LNDDTLSPDGTVALADGDVEVELPHAAMMMATAPAPAINVKDLSLRNSNPLLNVLVPGHRPLVLAASRPHIVRSAERMRKRKAAFARCCSNTL
jgi:hypothetical protein